MRSRLAPFLALLFTPVLLGQGVTHVKIAGRDVAVWKPSGKAPPAGFPVVLFSHGFTGCNTQSTFLMEAFAAAGYLAVAPNHKDARCGTAARSAGHRAGFSELRPEHPFDQPELWSDSTYRDRAEDVRIVLDSVLHGPTFEGVPVDAARIGISGHSLGGYTALGMAGGWSSWKDKRIKAVLALSPFCNPFVDKGDLAHMAVPVMYQGGSRDWGITPTVRRLTGAYDKSAAPKCYVEFTDAGHFAWTELNPRFQPLVKVYSVAFFDRYLKGTTPPDALAALLAPPRPANVSAVRADLH